MYGVTRIDNSGEAALISFNDIPLDITILANIFSCFSNEGIIIDMISQTAPVGARTSVAFTCMGSDLVKVLRLTRELDAKYPNILRPLVSPGNHKIQLYGEEMRHMHGVFARLLECLSGLEVEVKQITTSEVDISLLVGGEHFERVLSAIHKEFQVG